MLDVLDKNKAFRYRWVNKDDARIAKKMAEGWVHVNKESGISGEQVKPGKTEDGKPLTSGLQEYRELVLMALPEELGKARDEWVKKRTEQQTAALQHMDRDIKRNVGPAAGTYGKIQIKGD